MVCLNQTGRRVLSVLEGHVEEPAPPKQLAAILADSSGLRQDSWADSWACTCLGMDLQVVAGVLIGDDILG